MEIRLYVNTSPDNKINKELTEELILDVTVRKDFDLRYPELRLKIDDIGYNYMWIPNLKRYYFIMDKQSFNNDIITIQGAVDLLETYKEGILSSHAQYKRKLRTGDRLPADLEFTVDSESEVYKSGVDFDGDSSMILTTLGEGA